MKQDYANWKMEFHGKATTDKFKDVTLDEDTIDDLYDEKFSVEDALDEYLERHPEHKVKSKKK